MVRRGSTVRVRQRALRPRPHRSEAVPESRARVPLPRASSVPEAGVVHAATCGGDHRPRTRLPRRHPPARRCVRRAPCARAELEHAYPRSRIMSRRDRGPSRRRRARSRAGRAFGIARLRPKRTSSAPARARRAGGGGRSGPALRALGATRDRATTVVASTRSALRTSLHDPRPPSTIRPRELGMRRRIVAVDPASENRDRRSAGGQSAAMCLAVDSARQPV